MLAAHVQVTSAQIKTLFSAPLTVIGPPGANRVIVPIAIYARLIYAAPAYLAGGSLYLIKGSAGFKNGDFPGLENVIKAGADSDGHALTYEDTSAAIAVASDVNQPLKLGANGADFTTGNGTLDLVIFYAIAPSL